MEAAIAALGAGQHAVFTLEQLEALGLTRSAVRKRAAIGRLHRIRRGVYSLVPRALLTREGHWMAAVLACGRGAVLSHRTAAALLGLRPTDRTKIDVTVPGQSRPKQSGIDVHSSLTLSPADVTTENGIPCTTIARTVLDLAAVMPRRVIERVLDQADAMHVFDLIALNDQLARNPRHPGARLLRSVLEEHYVGSTPTESELEEAFLALTRRLGLPDPKTQRWIDLGDGLPMIRADFVWYEQRVIVETDGVRFHGTDQARERDPRRDQRAMVAGWRPVRTTWRQVMRRPQELEPTLRRLVAAAPRVAAG
ncbi:MAG TPA: type IV toxin-antitoxin system AbiEi family antitoxin domain-containing protein [Solirubrobacteraceae bacterium]|nr:type IV toxin-antitoxin system AbiEi family antitoxin domain-containing protein [Solirubrobacteraceae bacterium]